MEVEFTGHAGIHVTSGDTRVLMDPWFSPYGGFDASWFQLPCNHYMANRDWSGLTAVVVSHEHLDHLDPTFLRSLPESIPINIVGYPSPLFAHKLRSRTNRQPRIFPPGREHVLGGLRFRIWTEDSPMNQDSVWVFRDEQTSIVHTVDSRLSTQQLDEIIDYLDGPPTLLLVQCSGASWYPIVYENYDQAAKMERGRRKREHKLSYSMGMADYLQPETVVICAGPPVFLDPELEYANHDPSFPVPGESKAWFLERGYSRRVEAPLPGDVLDLVTGELREEPSIHAEFSWERVPEYVRHYAERMRPNIDEVYRRADEIPTPDLFEAFRGHFNKMLSLSEYFNERIDMTVCFDVEGPQGGQWLVDFKARPDVRKLHPGDTCQYRYRLHSRWLKRIVIEDVPWEDFLLSLRFSAFRDPDVYNDHLLGLIKFNDTASLMAVERYEKLTSQDTILVSTPDGQQYEISKYCPHAGASLEGAPIEGNTITCLLHHYEFDLESGECKTGNCRINTRRLDASTNSAR